MTVFLSCETISSLLCVVKLIYVNKVSSYMYTNPTTFYIHILHIRVFTYIQNTDSRLPFCLYYRSCLVSWYYSVMRSCILICIDSTFRNFFIPLFAFSFIPLFNYYFIICSFIHTLIHSLFSLFTHNLFRYSPIHLFIFNSLIHLFIFH